MGKGGIGAGDQVCVCWGGGMHGGARVGQRGIGEWRPSIYIAGMRPYKCHAYPGKLE